MIRRTYRTLCFLRRNRVALRKNLVCVLCQRDSFGHQIHTFDHTARTFTRNRITVIWYRNRRNSPHLIHQYPTLEGIEIGWKPGRWERFLLIVYLSAYGVRVIDEDVLFRMHSPALKQPCVANNHGVKAPTHDYTGWFWLTRKTMNPINRRLLVDDPRRNDELPVRTLVVLALRCRPEGTRLNALRCGGDFENYHRALSWLSERDDVVLASACETPMDAMKAYGSCVSLEEDRKMFGNEYVDLWLQMNCDVYIAQHSGAAYLPAACGAKVVLVDSLPHCQGLPGKGHLVLWKNLERHTTGVRFSPVRLFKTLPPEFYGDFSFDEFRTVDNSPEDIRKTVQEAVTGYTPPLEDGRVLNDYSLHRRWSSGAVLPRPDDCALKYSRMRPPIWLLDQAERETEEEHE